MHPLGERKRASAEINPVAPIAVDVVLVAETGVSGQVSVNCEKSHNQQRKKQEGGKKQQKGAPSPAPLRRHINLAEKHVSTWFPPEQVVEPEGDWP
jgi:hypothetical protein